MPAAPVAPAWGDLLQQRPARAGYVGRYAPSPTGSLHLGNLRTALVAWRRARGQAGVFLMRIEDIDRPRTVPGSEAQLLDDLRRLGIDWDEGPDVGGSAGPYRQSDRETLYAAALAWLESRGLTYGCRCSRKELRSIASAPHGAEGPVYPGKCREAGLTGPDLSIRFRTNDPGGDFVIRRRDGLWAYQLACAVDDGLMGITEVVRGEDLLESTPRQVALLQALQLPVPQYVHIPLVRDAAGERMSKRDGSAGLAAWRAQGVSPAEARQRLLALAPSWENIAHA